MQRKKSTHNIGMNKLVPKSPWHLVWMVTLAAVILTYVINFFQGIYWYSNISHDLLIIGTIDAIIVSLIVTPIAIGLGLSHQKEIQNELREFALTDELTGIYNRRGFNFLAEHLIKISNRTQTAMYLMFADLDDFKSINDEFGHAEGDRVLKEFAHLLRKSYRESDIVARLGGDEFVLLPVGTSKDGMDVIQNRFHKILAKYNQAHDHPWKISASIGIAYYDPISPISLDDLLRKADEALYQNKNK